MVINYIIRTTYVALTQFPDLSIFGHTHTWVILVHKVFAVKLSNGKTVENDRRNDHN